MANSIVKKRFFSGMKWREGDKWGFWFRVFGYGLNVNNQDLMFSQRNGYGPAFLLIGKIKIMALTP